MTDAAPLRQRLLSIDALRGLVILFMLLDHVRETFLLHRQVGDPMSIDTTEPALFISRTLAHLCAPVFVLLTGLSAFLYGQKYQGRRDVSAFLFKRGLFLVVLEFTLVNFAWTFQLPPSVVYMQVIWAIGVSMLALAALVWLPRPLLIALALMIIGGHNLLDGLHFTPGSPAQTLWSILHERSWIQASDTLRLRITYPVLPWIGVIALGYGIGPWFANGMPPALRQRYLLVGGVSALVGFVLVRAANGYGEKRLAGLRKRRADVDELFQCNQVPAFATVSGIDAGGWVVAVAGVGTRGASTLDRRVGGVWFRADVLLPAASLCAQSAVYRLRCVVWA